MTTYSCDKCDATYELDEAKFENQPEFISAKEAASKDNWTRTCVNRKMTPDEKRARMSLIREAFDKYGNNTDDARRVIKNFSKVTAYIETLCPIHSKEK